MIFLSRARGCLRKRRKDLIEPNVIGLARVYIIYQKYNIETKMREHIYTIEYNTSIFKIAHMDISGNAYIFQLQITVLQLLRISNT